MHQNENTPVSRLNSEKTSYSGIRINNTYSDFLIKPYGSVDFSSGTLFNNEDEKKNDKQNFVFFSKATLGITRAIAMQIAPTAIYAVPRKSFFPLLSHKIKFPTSVEHSCTGRIYKPGPGARLKACKGTVSMCIPNPACSGQNH